MISLLDAAIKIAVNAHFGQVDKANQPYILHPLRVMFSLTDERDMIVGILHDVIEDTDVTYEYLLANGFEDEPEILEAIKSVTRKENETYEEFINRAAMNSIGRRVKLADLRDNMNIMRILSPTEEDYNRVEKYRKAKEKLEQAQRTSNAKQF